MTNDTKPQSANSNIHNNCYSAQDIQQAVKSILEKAHISEENSQFLLSELAKLEEDYNQQILSKTQNNTEFMRLKLQNIWGDNVNTNINFVKRAMQWLGIENLSDINNLDEIEFLNKLLNLGKLLSEDSGISGGYSNQEFSKEQALRKRAELTNDPSFVDLITNKASMGHKEAMKKLNMLNEVIANYK